MKHKSSKSIINSTMSNSSKYLDHTNNDIHITPDNYLEAIPQYRVSHNAFVSKSMHLRLAEHTALNVMDTKALKYALQHATVGYVSDSAKGLHLQSILLAFQLANPQAWACYPIIDKLHITVDVAEDEMNELYRQLPSIYESTQFRCSKKKTKRQNGQFYSDVLTFSLKTDKTAQIRIFFGDNAKSRATQHNKLRFELIPARFTPKQISEFFYQLKRSKCIKDYKAKMQNAKVTRCDVAIDLLCVSTPLVIVDKPKVKHFSNHSQHEHKEMRFVQTMYICKQGDSHIVVYSKSEKLLEKSHKQAKNRLSMLINEDGNPLSISRYENVYRPQQSGSTLLLQDLHKMSHLFKSVEIYNPDILSNLNEAERKLALRDGLMVYLKNEYDETAFMARSEMLQRHAMFINRKQFKLMQEKVLRKLRKCIISPKA
ncbi:hypothetical protein HT094_02275 [Shewanella sp. ZOR0012]|uniref:hypothetical protein n=1 Tax=Shewanella sp. ZOR0012 TaxID=1339231 RepID=UPI000646A905|nr:hypothetical protein [Shewanella sp. ZOR0012]NSM23264.1 hypothetical protein [Shewanella sp. ZOR0012]